MGSSIYFASTAAVHFNFNSAVMLPRHSDEGAEAWPPLTGIGVLGLCLKYSRRNPSRPLLITGHTDTYGTADQNRKIAVMRSQSVQFLLRGNREEWATLVASQQCDDDVRSILKWISDTWEGDWNEADILAYKDARYTRRASIKTFQDWYNQGQNPEFIIKADGLLGKETWRAFFDCYQWAMCVELCIDDWNDFFALQESLRFHESSPSGCGEAFPIEQPGRDNYQCATNRRVEILFLDPTSPVSLTCHNINQPTKTPFGVCPIYQSSVSRTALWFAEWDVDQVSRGETAGMTVWGTDFAAGQVVVFEVWQQVGTRSAKLGEVSAMAENGFAQATWSMWFDRTAVVTQGLVTTFPAVKFTFIVRRDTRTESAGDHITYSDTLALCLRAGDPQQTNPVAGQTYTILSPWGRKSGQTDAFGNIREEGLPPGGLSIAIQGRVIHSGWITEV